MVNMLVVYRERKVVRVESFLRGKTISELEKIPYVFGICSSEPISS